MANSTNNMHYNEEDIQILEGLEAVRKRPGMYIGSTDGRGLHHLLWEIVDNAVDEAIAGFGKEIVVKLHKDNSITVIDNGRGVPVGKHSSGQSTPIVVYTKLHAGGKFNDKGGYKTASGLHGVGASVVNALSEWMNVTIVRDFKTYEVKFARGGKVVSDLKEIPVNTNKRSGTTVSFKPDPTIFTVTNFNHSTICEKLRETAFLMPGVKFVFDDEIINKKESYCYENGVVEFVKFNCEGKNMLHDVVCINGDDRKGISFTMAFVYTDSYEDDDRNVLSFVNNVRTIDGGTHEVGLRSAFTRAFNDYAKENNLLKNKDKSLDGHDIREGLNIVLSVKIIEDLLQFESQTKSKLGTPAARNTVDYYVYDGLSHYLQENKATAEMLVGKALKAQLARDAARKAKEEARSGKKVKQERLISDKLSPAQSKDLSLNELFLVEGDSAGGSAKQGRNSKYQAILPLRGKVINSEKQAISTLLKNEEINTIIYTVGAGVGQEFDVKDSHYGKIIIMTDADTDGAHIQVLLLTFFFRYMRPLIENGMVYVALPPLYKVSKKTAKGEVFKYAWNDIDLAKAKKEIGENAYVQRYKGLGEMNPTQLWETTMNPQTRTLLRVDIDDFTIADRRISILMGDKTDLRREWIEENVHFTLEDEFAKEEQ